MYKNYYRKMALKEIMLWRLEELLTMELIVVGIILLLALMFGEINLIRLEKIYPTKMVEICVESQISIRKQFEKYIDSLEIPTEDLLPIETMETEQNLVKAKAYNANLPFEINVDNITPKVSTFNISAYCACKKCCGKTDGITASGKKATEWCTIAAGKEYAFGTVIYIPDLADKPNGGWFIVQDRGSAISDEKLDIYMPTHEGALNFERQYLECYVYEVEN